MSYKTVVGVDFDNTIVNYDYIVTKLAYEKKFINEFTTKSKKFIRDYVRQLPDGETKWQELQAGIYGSRMEEATLIDGVMEFFNLCKNKKIKVFIVSHKTEFSNLGKSKINFRVAALDWMKKKGFFKFYGLGLAPNDIYFESTRHEKIYRIKQLKCTHFIDDLEETLLEDSFPTDIEKILYSSHKKYSSVTGIRVFSTWEEISNYFFCAIG